MADLSFVDFKDIPSEDEFAPLPAGDYKAVISSTEMKQTKAGNGSYLKVKYQIVDGKYQNRVVFDNLNLENPNPTAVKIGRQMLSKLCHACGFESIRDSSELHNKVVAVTLKVRKSEDYGDSNEVAKVKPAAEAAVAHAEPTQTEGGGPVAF